ncbi:MAG: Holliday junction resolvase RuvX [Patescibacteria group bacterium]
MLPNKSILALDVGDVRVGVALARPESGLAQPHKILLNDDMLIRNIQEIISEFNVGVLVVGLPRNLDGQDTAQTKKVRMFTESLKTQITATIHCQDEALSSVRAREAIALGNSAGEKVDIDAMAASYILDDYLNERKIAKK